MAQRKMADDSFDNINIKHKNIMQLLTLDEQIPIELEFTSNGAIPKGSTSQQKSSDLNERLLSTMERHITFLEKELIRKDILIDKLTTMLSNSNSSNTLQGSEDTTLSLPLKSNNIPKESDHNKNIKTDEKKGEKRNEQNTAKKNTKLKEQHEDTAKSKIENQHDQISGPKENKNNNEERQERSGRNSNKKRLTCVIGDSMIKNMKGWKVNKTLEDDFIVVKSFPGAKTTCMKHYLAPTLEQKPDSVVLHVGTNDLKGKDTASEISKRIVDLAMNCAEHSTKVVVSGLVKRGDELNGKAEAVNTILKGSCSKRNIAFIEHNNIGMHDLNNSKLHLNKIGASKLNSNILNFISKV